VRIDQRIRADPGAAVDGVRRGVVRDPDETDPVTGPDCMPSRMDQHRPKPRVEGIRVAQSGQVPPDHHERLLHDIVGIDAAAADRPDKPPRGVEMARHEAGERLRVAQLGTLDESALAPVLWHCHKGPR